VWTVHRGIAARGHVRSPAAYHPVISTNAIPQSLAVMYTLSLLVQKAGQVNQSQRGEDVAMEVEVPAWAPRPGRNSPPLDRVAKTVQPGFTRAWPGMGEYPT
jgi:hypothetical protein